jgi:predicted thioesterase/uncharacterized glyoxalase superfamily protein PhnB
MKDSLRPGIQYQHRLVLPPSKMVPALYPEAQEFQAMPEVFATGFLVGFLEWACIKAINAHLDWPKEQSVGTHIRVTHEAATPAGFEVTASVELIAVEGRKLTFAVSAHDGVDLISSGTHQRVVIDKQRFVDKTSAKAAAHVMPQASAPNPIPAAHRIATPYLIVSSGADAISFYSQAFGAIELVRLADSSGKVMHAELQIDETRVMLADEFPDMGYVSPLALGGSPVSLLLYVADVDARFALALAAGATGTLPVADQFDGDRRGTLTDPFGHVWLLASKLEDISLQEMQRRFQGMIESGHF